MGSRYYCAEAHRPGVDTGMALLFALGVGLGIVVLLTVIRGWVLTCLWSWFVIPVFHLDPLSIKMAIGLSLVAGMFMQASSSSESKEDNGTGKLVVHLALPFITLFIGWLVHSC